MKADSHSLVMLILDTVLLLLVFVRAKEKSPAENELNQTFD
jgi:hypothetical protein